MSKLRVKRAVLNRARRIVNQRRTEQVVPTTPSFPVVRLWYPTHGTGVPTERIVKVTQMNGDNIRGFQLESETDQGRGTPRTFKTAKVFSILELIGLQ